jgi:hypothetical protein
MPIRTGLVSPTPQDQIGKLERTAGADEAHRVLAAVGDLPAFPGCHLETPWRHRRIGDEGGGKGAIGEDDEDRRTIFDREAATARLASVDASTISPQM